MRSALYVEISVVGICLLLIVLLSQRDNAGASAVQRYFNRLVFATIAMLITDAVCWLIDGTTYPFAKIASTIVETIYYFFNILIPYLWVAYLEAALGNNPKTTHRRLWLLAIPLMLLSVLLFVNLHTATVFIIDDNNVYHRNPGFLAYAVLAYLYLGYASIRTLAAARHANWNEDKRRYLTMAFFGVLPAIGGMIQIFLYGVALIWIFVAVSTVLMYIDSLNRQISTDPLTGINNRRELTKYLIRETKNDSYKGVLALLMIDVDGFKQVNDTYGHYYGDGVLITVSELLKQSCKNTPAFLARYGGDEFCIVYPAEGIQAVENMIAGIHSNISQWNSQHNEPANIGLSIGYSVWYPESDENVDSLFQRADQKMYQAKTQSKEHT